MVFYLRDLIQQPTLAHAQPGSILAVAGLVGHIRIRLKVRGFTRGHSGFNGHGSRTWDDNRLPDVASRHDPARSGREQQGVINHGAVSDATARAAKRPWGL